MLFVPGDKEELISKAWRYSPDAIIFDLEDSVSQERKAKARQLVKSAISSETGKYFVRINSTKSDYIYEDVSLLVGEKIEGFIIPKVENGNDINFVENMIKIYSHQNSMPSYNYKLVATVESIKGLENIREIASSGHLRKSLGLGYMDLCFDSGITFSNESFFLREAMSRTIIISSLWNLEPPHDGAYPFIDDDVGLKENLRISKSMGLRVKHAIHPRQIPIINEIFRYKEEEIAEAKLIVSTYETALKQGNASIRVGNKMVDYPVYKNALRIVKFLNNGGVKNE